MSEPDPRKRPDAPDPAAPLPAWRYWAWLAALLAIAFAWGALDRGEPVESISYTEFRQAVDDGRVARVTLRGREVKGVYADADAGGAGEGAAAGRSGAPGQEKAAPAQEKAAPAQGEGAPAQGEGAPAQGEGAPAQGQGPPAQEEGAPDARGGAGPRHFATTLPVVEQPRLLERLEAQGVEVTAVSPDPPWWQRTLLGMLPWVLLLVLIFWGTRKMQERMMGAGGQGGILGFGKSRAKRFREEHSEVGLADVAGAESAKQDLEEVIAHLKEPERFRALGAKVPKGVLLLGPPGTGKTLLARATAGEAGVPFYTISGSEFVEMFVGVGAARVRDLFDAARKEAPAVIFVDEIDAVGRSRGAGLGGGHDEREQTLNQILSEMDGFSPHENLVVMAATNRPDVLDRALLRPGRFDRKVTLELPGREARRAILEVHVRGVPLAEDVDLDTLAARTVTFSGADLENLVNEAALRAGRERRERVDMATFDGARDKLVLGAERDSPLSDAERELVAHHEAGHALVAWLLPEADPLDKVTVIPHGRALGATEQRPEEERRNIRQGDLLARIAVMLGGRAAERVMWDQVSTGAEQDLKQATQLARRMVSQWGMSEALGPVAFRQGEEHVFLGQELAQGREYSEDTARVIDDQVRDLLLAREEQTLELLRAHRERLAALAAALLERETLTADEVSALFGETGQAA